MPDYFAQLELTSGEGIVHKISSERRLPCYVRFYADTTKPWNECFEDPNAQHIYELLLEDWGVGEWLGGIVAGVISVQVVPVYPPFPEAIGKRVEEAKEVIVERGLVPRVILQDGVAAPINADVQNNRVNLWAAHNVIYRAEIF